MIPPTDAIGTITKLIELGQQIRQRYQIYSHAREDLSELDSRLHSSLFVMDVFEKVIRRGLGGLPVKHQHEISRLVDHLQGVFDRLDKQLSRFPRDEKFDIVGKLRWTFGGKSGHGAILQEMKEWRSDLYITVSAIKLLQEEEQQDAKDLYNQLFEEEVGGRATYCAAVMDRALRNYDPANGTTSTVPELATILSSSDPDNILPDGDQEIHQSQAVFIEYRYEESRSSQETQDFLADVQKLALVLSKVDAPSMHILRCKGTIHQSDFKRSVLLYELPSVPQQSPWTLSQAIADKSTARPALDVRVQYAVDIATSVMFTHAAGLVHKSICPENILILSSSFRPKSYEARFPYETFLTGFDAARLRDLSAYSEQRPETDKLRKIYHHPERQSSDPSQTKVVRFGIRHDMYSLGIVLLELAMWSRIQKFHDQKLKGLIDGTDPYALQQRLVHLAREYLSGLMGPRYTDAVVCCLKNWDSNGPSGERAMREVFYERVLRQLQGIVV